MSKFKKAAKGTLAVGTLGMSTAAKKAVDSGLAVGRQTDLTSEEIASGVLFRASSSEVGRNSQVTLLADRIERVKERSRLSVSGAHQDVEVTPLSAVSSVQAKKDGLAFTKVIVFASGNNIEFRFRHDDAHRFRDIITEQILQRDGASSGPQATPPVAENAAVLALDPSDQLRKLAELKDAGIITEEEFAEKKTEILGRM
jgi:hypothetical protein